MLSSSSALETARRLEQRELTTREVVAHYLDRIRDLDGELSAFVEVHDREARRQAARTTPSGGLSGIPVAVKDLNAVRLSHMRLGSRAATRLWTPFDDLAVRRLRRAGMIVLGKASTSELGVLPVTEPAIHPPTRNPHHPEYSAGGSSGGSAAAVAAMLCPLALGSDGAGSIRIPASFCGVVGLKPSRGLVVNPFGMDDPDLIWTCGPIAGNVADAAAMLDVLADPGSTRLEGALSILQRRRSGHPEPALKPRFVAQLRDEPAALEVRFTTRSVLGQSDPAVAQAVRHVAALLERLGHRVREMEPLGGTTPEEFLPLWQVNSMVMPWLDERRLEPFTRWLRQGSRRVDKRRTRELARTIARRVFHAFADADVWLTPTVMSTAPRVGSFRGLTPLETFERAARIAAFTAPFNLTGQPAISIPVASSPEGLPIGAQLVGRPHADLGLLQLAATLESELDFARLPRAAQPWFRH